ncbi:glycosyl hydrolase family 65 protein [Nocardioides rubriscoriae]|uniref:glycosyl hydrolase family 65 protein n=1 Tax=Nocardioides rubriscoriae TaxID=642762 RepID=UPI0011E0309D|nr:glycosyl hydrolase family 65 protein [Nocardioides rubriscoriae]
MTRSPTGGPGVSGDLAVRSTGRPAPREPLARSVAAVVVSRRAIGGPVTTRLEQLARLGLRVVVVADAAPAGCTASGSAHEALARLDELGVTGRLVLLVDSHADLPAPPGSDATTVPVDGTDGVLALLDEQLRRARSHRVPDVVHDPRWAVVERGVDPARHRVTESLFTLASGGVGWRGSVEESPDYGQPLVVAAGVYAGTGVHDGLLPGPDLVDVRLRDEVQADERVLDLRTGVLYREEVGGSGVPLRSLRFAAAGAPGVFALRVEAASQRMDPGPSPEHGTWSATTPAVGHHGGIGAVARQEVGHDAGVTTLERLVAVDHTTRGRPRRARAQERLDRAGRAGFEALLAEQRAAWAQRWSRVDVRIPDDPGSELALRFALFHLWGLASDGAELAVGARALTGSGYAGHVFWDADVFVLPALATIDPEAADAMVRYRLHRLGAARERARSEARRGARFPWESAATGQDVTPARGWVGGEQVDIVTGTQEEHVTADVAWAVVHNATWSRPGAHLSDGERALLAATARYWASRTDTDPDGTAHVTGVTGPDEYHEGVDDNAFTNVMARWNLRAAARLTRAHDDECRSWLRRAAALVDGYDETTGVYEQFRGYRDLQPLVVTDLAPPPVAADVLVGRDRVARSQLIKQPDVLMLHHLVPDEVVAGSLVTNLDLYAPRTAHGSSLSPATMALVHARAGRPEAALDLLRLSLSIDLDDLGGTTSAGVHIGALGGAWQALLFGFLGARVRDGVLHLDPVLPAAWPRLAVRFRALGRDVRVDVDADLMTVAASGALAAHVPASQPYRVRADGDVHLVGAGAP